MQLDVIRPGGALGRGFHRLKNCSQGRFAGFSFYLFAIISVVAIFIPLNPRMPNKGLDASWEFAMNEAVARHLSFGSEVLFTYGPYASIGTRSYHPATDARMMCGSVLVAVSYLTALLYLANGRKRILVILILLVFATFASAEVLLLSYALLLGASSLKYIDDPDVQRSAVRGWIRILAIVVMWATLGLLPSVKGSLLLPFAASVVFPSVLLLYRHRFWAATLLFIVPVVASLAFWCMAAQSLFDLPAFLKGTVALTSGYTEAMSTSWVVLPAVVGDVFVLLFLIASVLVTFSIARSRRISKDSRWLLAALFAVFFLVTFKHGFVKAEGVSGAFLSLAVCIIIIGLLYIDRYLVWSLSICLALTVSTSVIQDAVLRDQVHKRFGSDITASGEARRDILAFCAERALGAYARSSYQATWNTYRQAWNGLRIRMSRGERLDEQFAVAVAQIRESYPIPQLTGSADFYNYEQSVLVATKNTWNPRPVFQSYSVYTPGLVKLNEQHLRGADAPDWVMIDLQTIDGRLPSLDDGMSWPAIFDNYLFVSYNGQFVLMRRKTQIRPNGSYREILSKECKLGEANAIPGDEGPLFAEIELKPTFAGKLLIELFSPPQLQITVHLEGGQTKKYRVVSEMMHTGFLLSPLVSNTSDFGSLANQDGRINSQARVTQISIAPSYGGSAFWSGTYRLRLKKYIWQ